jgi:hypothetical protein
MGAESFLLYYGLRFAVSDEEISSLESKTHPFQVEAVKAGLDSWWGNFDTGGGEDYFLFVGKELGVLGAEYQDSLNVNDDSLAQVMQQTKEKLKRAGFRKMPSLLAQWEPDF